MSRSHLVLGAIALGVLAFGMYLLHAVRAAPAIVTPVTADQVAPTPPPPVEHEVTPTPSVPDAPRPHVGGRGLSGRSPMAPRGEPNPPLHPTLADPTKPHPNLEAMMDEANKAYDGQEFDQAKALALKVLESLPGNVRMMRILVSSYCADSDQAQAQAIYVQLPKHDREQMKVRCERTGVTFTDPPE